MLRMVLVVVVSSIESTSQNNEQNTDTLIQRGHSNEEPALPTGDSFNPNTNNIS